MKPQILVFETENAVSDELCKFVVEKSRTAIEGKGIFTLGVSGGSIATSLCCGLPSLVSSTKTDWTKWRIFLCDERHVPLADQECTYRLYSDAFCDLPPETIFPINPELTVEEAATDYAQRITIVFPGEDLPRFDLLLLGMGPDGHTCSLFPGHPLLKEKQRIIAPVSDSPKPPPRRITMTYPIINNAACCAFASCGETKAQVVQRVLEGNEIEPLPAARVLPTNGDLLWFLDKGAASKLLNH